MSLESARLSGIKTADVREITFDVLDSILEEGARCGSTSLDLFTDEELRTQRLYYLSRPTLSRISLKYDLPAVTPLSGISLDGKDFFMTALILGRGRVDTSSPHRAI